MAARKKQTADSAVREIRRRTRRKFSAEEKIRIVLEGLRGEVSVAGGGATQFDQYANSSSGCAD